MYCPTQQSAFSSSPQKSISCLSKRSCSLCMPVNRHLEFGPKPRRLATPTHPQTLRHQPKDLCPLQHQHLSHQSHHWYQLFDFLHLCQPYQKKLTTTTSPWVHPFTRAKDTAYAPPTTNNIAAKPKPALPKKPDVPLRTTAPIYDPQVASAVYVHMMDSQITITQCELLSLSPEVRNQVCEGTSNQCITRTETSVMSRRNACNLFHCGPFPDNEDPHPR